MTAPTRRNDAAAHDLWQEAARLRQEWLDHALSTRPADRAAAEHSLTRIYARMSRPRPRFVWVDSPRQALPLVAGLPTLDALHEWTRDPRSSWPPPLASDLAKVASLLRSALSDSVFHADPELSPARRGKGENPWPDLPPRDALARGVPLGVVVHRSIRNALFRSLAKGFYLPVRAALAAQRPVPVCWYGQQDASWIGYYDILQRLGLAWFASDAAAHLDEWATLARSGGWWWPGEELCVVVERPHTVHTEPVPGGLHGEVRLRRDGVEYRDGWRPSVTVG